MIQIYGRKKCAVTRKAQRFFSERRIRIQFVDLDQKAPGRRELELFVQAAGADNLIDSQSKFYASRGLAYMDFDPAAELEENPGLIVTPIVRSGRRVVVGENEAAWREIADADVVGGGQKGEAS